MSEERLQKFLARAGVASRRRCEELIRDGHVCVNGQVATELGTKVDPGRDKVTVDRRQVRLPQACTYLLLHKPTGYVTTRRDDKGRPTVMELLPARYRHLHHVGRLDYDSSGLLLLTDDGELTQRLTHPRHEIEKTYRVTVVGTPARDALQRLAKGVQLEDGPTAPARVRTLGPSALELTIREGRNRQVRRMLDAVGHPVIGLQRVRLGKLTLGDLAEGKFRLLTAGEVTALLTQ